MNRFFYIFITTLIILFLFIAGMTRHEVNIFNLPLYADEVKKDSLVADTTTTLPWLHVEVETSWGWFWQKSSGKAYTYASKDSKQRVKVGNLCIKLEAHETHQFCEVNADSIVITEKKRGIAIPKRTAIVTAWAENPKLGPSTASLEP
jgi:hypothetical protein